jgi:hypothetical protein
MLFMRGTSSTPLAGTRQEPCQCDGRIPSPACGRSKCWSGLAKSGVWPLRPPFHPHPALPDMLRNAAAARQNTAADWTLRSPASRCLGSRCCKARQREQPWGSLPGASGAQTCRFEKSPWVRSTGRACLTVPTYRARARLTLSAVTTRWSVAEVPLIPVRPLTCIVGIVPSGGRVPGRPIAGTRPGSQATPGKDYPCGLPLVLASGRLAHAMLRRATAPAGALTTRGGVGRDVLGQSNPAPLLGNLARNRPRSPTGGM